MVPDLWPRTGVSPDPEAAAAIEKTVEGNAGDAGEKGPGW
jgi:hypothetical protein